MTHQGTKETQKHLFVVFDTQRCARLCLPNAGITGVHHYLGEEIAPVTICVLGSYVCMCAMPCAMTFLYSGGRKAQAVPRGCEMASAAKTVCHTRLVSLIPRTQSARKNPIPENFLPTSIQVPWHSCSPSLSPHIYLSFPLPHKK